MEREKASEFIPRVRREKGPWLLDGVWRNWVFCGYVVQTFHGKKNQIIDPVYFATYADASHYAHRHPAVIDRLRIRVRPG